MPSSNPNPVQRAPGFAESAFEALLKFGKVYRYVLAVLLPAAIAAWLTFFVLKVTDIVSTYDRGLNVAVVEWPQGRYHHIAWVVGAVFGVIRQLRDSRAPALAGGDAHAPPQSIATGAKEA